jgi:alpha-tubulin suppressor-like RCC1 family protein
MSWTGTRRAIAALAALLALGCALVCGSASAATAPLAGSSFAESVFSEGGTPPKITKQPTNKTANEGTNAVFESTASGTPAPTVQWELSTNGGGAWSQVPGATSATLTVESVKAAQDGNQYRALWSNTAGTVTSKAVTLTVHYAPIITKQPISATVEEGQNAVFEAAATSDPAPTVKWEVSKNGGSTWTAVKEATSPTLTITAAKTSESGNLYRASFKNSIGTTNTEAATLTVRKAPAVTKQPAGATVAEGNDATFEATASGFPAPSVQWEVSEDGGGTWQALEGATTTPLVLQAVTHLQDGNEYRAVFSNPAGSVTTEAATLTVRSPPQITQQPSSTIVVVGEEAVFEAQATGFPTPTVQWELSTNGGASWAAIEGATSDQLAIPNPQLAQNGNEYRAVFSNEGGNTHTSAATLTVASAKYSAVAWGQNLYRQLGNGSNNAEFDVPVEVSGLSFVTAVSAGGRHSLALIANGAVDAWGYNVSGQVGDGTNATKSTPVELPGVSGAKAIAAGGEHSLALLSGGTVEAWGANESGQLGTGTNAESTVPVAVSGLSGVTAIAAGAEHSLALLSGGTVKAWGANENGQLGTGSLKASNAPVAVKNLNGVVAIAAGEDFSLALLSNGTVKAWGSNLFGQLGNTSVEETSNVPVTVSSLSGVTAIAAGAKHALALLSGGGVMAWGDDRAGEIGNGAIKNDVETPVAVSGISTAKAIDAGSQDSVAVVGSGAVMTWGINEWGTLGDGVIGGPSDVPVEVEGIAKAASISAGGAHMLAFGEPRPAVTAVSPATGTIAGGTTVTISGANLTGATSVMFGSTPAAGYTVESPNAITATAPAHAAGTVDITVTTPAGTSGSNSGDRFTFQGTPTVSKLSLKAGPTAGGTVVVITGTGFAGASAVNFGSSPAATFTVKSDTSITATSPATSAAKVHITVTNSAGTSATSSKDFFSFTPTVTSVSPNGGSTTGGTTVTVTGTGFATASGGTLFKFGTAKATSVVCASATECTMKSPAGTAGTVNVIATVNKVKSPVNAPADSYTYS